MPPQIVRLVQLTVLIVGSYLVARIFLTPSSYGEFGHFRGAAIGEAAAKEPVHAGAKACDECHGEVFALQAKGPHQSISCESCHPVARSHVENPEIKVPPLDKNFCFTCHAPVVGRPEWHKQVVASEHYPDDKCMDCHLPHHPTDQSQ